MAFKMTNAPYKKGFFSRWLNSSSGKRRLTGQALKDRLKKDINQTRG